MRLTLFAAPLALTSASSTSKDHKPQGSRLRQPAPDIRSQQQKVTIYAEIYCEHNGEYTLNCNEEDVGTYANLNLIGLCDIGFRAENLSCEEATTAVEKNACELYERGTWEPKQVYRWDVACEPKSTG